jgi:uncharacterized OB-fold protein
MAQDDPKTGKVQVMDHFVSLTYEQTGTSVGREFAAGLLEGRIVGHRCPTCQRVYVPPKGFCPMDATVTTTADHGVEVEHTGTVTTYTIIDPIQYYGQQERDPYVQANVILDGASSAITYARVKDIPLDAVRAGLRVQAVWLPPAERDAGVGEAFGNRGLMGCISHFAPSGEPDAPWEAFKDLVM